MKQVTADLWEHGARRTEPGPAPSGWHQTRIRCATLCAIALTLVLLLAPADVQARVRSDRSTTKAMWWSILHPGLGEWYLQGWGEFEKCPQKKFWLGFIPLYGWPGYLQVKSATDAKHGRTNDKLTFD